MFCIKRLSVSYIVSLRSETDVGHVAAQSARATEACGVTRESRWRGPQEARMKQPGMHAAHDPIRTLPQELHACQDYVQCMTRRRWTRAD